MSGRASTVVVGPHRFVDLAPERDILEPLGAAVRSAGSARELVELAPAADVLLAGPLATVDAGLVRLLRRCAGIVRYGVGVDNIDLVAARQAGMQVANVPDASVEEVATHAVALILALLRRLPAAHDAFRTMRWPIEMMRGARRPSGLTCGIVGAGRIGRATGLRLEALGFRVLAHDPLVDDCPFTRVELEELLAAANVVSLHVPLGPDTRDLLSARRLTLLPDGAIVVNVSRGGLVDEHALAAELVSGRLGGAGLDVFAEEPLPEDHPLRTTPGALLTPHVAWYSTEAARDLQRLAALEAARILRGEPLRHPVTG